MSINIIAVKNKNHLIKVALSGRQDDLLTRKTLIINYLSTSKYLCNRIGNYNINIPN